MVGLLKGIGALKVPLVVKVLAYRVVRRPSRAGYARQGIGGIIKIVPESANNLSSALFRPFTRGGRCAGIEVTFQFHARFDQFDAELHTMLDKELAGRELEGYFDACTPPTTGKRAEIRRRKIIHQFEDNFTNATNTLPGVAGTAWAAYNAVSQYFDHQRNFKGANSLEKADHQLESIWFGSSHHAKQEAYQRALTLAAG